MTISPAYPDLLQNGTPADATQVMADFYQIQNDVNANAAANGANSDITSLSGLLTAISIAQGGTGAKTAAAALLALAAAPLASPAFTGTPTAPTPTAGDNSTEIATTAFVAGAGYLTGAAAAATYAPLASPALTGAPTAPTAAVGNNTTQLATTAFALANSALHTFFESSEVAITAGALFSVAHGLGAIPRDSYIILRCKTIDQGYAVGDEVRLTEATDGGGGTAFFNGFPGVNSTNVFAWISASGCALFSKSGAGTLNLITLSSWRLVARAFL